MPESPPPAVDVDAVCTLAQQLLIDPEDATPADVCRLARVALDFAVLLKSYVQLQKQYAELSQTTELRRSHAVLQKEFVELSESKAQTIDRCSELLNENRLLKKITFDVSEASILARKISEWANHVANQMDEDS